MADEKTVAPAAKPAARKPVEEWARLKKTTPGVFKATAVGKRWPLGAELLEAEYDAAISNTTTFVVR